jgi:hypothetical protein
VVHALSSFCLWEAINRLLHGQWPAPRNERTPIGGQLVVHRFYDPLLLFREAFAAEFVRRDVYALSLIAAPPWLRRAPSFVARPVLCFDGLVGRAFPGAGDFFVLDLEKRQ